MKLAVVAPVYHRPDAAKPFVDSLSASLSEGGADLDVFAVATHGDEDTGQAWSWNGADMRYSKYVSFPDKAQWAYETLTNEHDYFDPPEFILLIGDDVRFHPGWYEAFLEAAEDPSAGLISTNDMGNPYVMAGTHATHPIFRVSYVEERGASWDGPGHIVHTGYYHSWVDEEWSTKAKHDGVFRYAENCRIEHLHPTWGKGQQDAVYKIARDHLIDDQGLYIARHARAVSEGMA